MMSDFNPNIHVYLWATYIPTRSPNFKVHYEFGHATNAIKHSSHFSGDSPGAREIPVNNKLYKLVDGVWEELKLRESFSYEEPSILG